MLIGLPFKLRDSMRRVRCFLQRPIRFKRGAVAKTDRPVSAGSKARKDQRQRVRSMRHDLYELLERHAGSRLVMRHIDLVERTLRHKGLAAMEALPVRVLSKAHAQLEQLVWDWSSPGLAELRSRMSVIVKTRPAEEVAKEEAAHAAAVEANERGDLAGFGHGLFTAEAAEVTEMHQAAFDEMERSWAGRVPNAATATVHATPSAGSVAV